MKLNIEAGLTLSLLGGLVDIKGYAEYLKDTTSSSNVTKVSLTYKETTVYREITSDYRDLLTNDENKDEFTHIVVGIQYGRTCTMVFEREIKDGETKEEIEGTLSVVLESIPISGATSLKLNSYEKEKFDDFKCTIYSDLKLDTSVANWDQALSLCKSLPTKLQVSDQTEAKKGVPVKICLLPKNLLGSQHDTLVKELPNLILNKAKGITESLTEAIQLVQNYAKTFQKDILSVLLVAIRSGTEDEKLLFDAFEKHECFPFGHLNIWIRRIKDEADILLAIQNQFLDKCVFFSNKTLEQNIVKNRTNVVFTLRVYKNEDKFIDEMESYYNSLTKNETTRSGEEILDILNKGKWFQDELIKEKMREMANQMRIFASANLLNEDIGFFVREMECEETPDCCIDVWEKGKKLPFMSFEPPTEIRNLQIKEYSHNTMEIKWNLPKKGRSNILNYRIEVSGVSVVDEKENLQLLDQINISPAADETMTHIITNLRPGQVYQVAVQCFCLNNHAFSKPVDLYQMTRLSNPPIGFKGKVKQKRHIKLTWENPTIKADSVNLKSFLIEYKTTNEKSWLIKTVRSDVKSYSLPNLSYGTEYQFRILACYDGEKETLPSEDIKLKTEPMEVPLIEKVYRFFCLYRFKEI